MKYEEMSDIEINQSVTGLMFDCAEWPLTQCGKYFYHCGIDGGAYFDREVVDYCSNPTDAWPIIYENEISLVVVDDDTWVARIGGIYSESSRPLRAAMIVFLMMQEDAQ